MRLEDSYESGTPAGALPVSAAAASAARLKTSLKPLFDAAAQFEDAEELVVNRPGEILVECGDGIWKPVMVTGLGQAQLHSMALAVAKSTSQGFTDESPMLFGTLPTGERLTFIGPPVTPQGTLSLTMRLVKKQVARTLSAYDGTDFFERFRWVEASKTDLQSVEETDHKLVQLLQARQLRQFLIEAVRRRKTIGILGDTGSGKTFLMECLIQEIDKNERLITVESARELQLPNHINKVQLLYSHFGTGRAGVNASDLVALTKRMKPKRVLLGECIGAEAFVFINMVISGHPGSITSWHAKSLSLARERFVLMCSEHEQARTRSAEDLRKLFDQSVDVMLYIDVVPTANGGKHRYVKEMSFRPTAVGGEE